MQLEYRTSSKDNREKRRVCLLDGLKEERKRYWVTIKEAKNRSRKWTEKKIDRPSLWTSQYAEPIIIIFIDYYSHKFMV